MMSETSTQSPDGGPRIPTKFDLYRELHALTHQYFHGPFTNPDTRDLVGRRLRDLLVTIDRREVVE
jgi:hypothetical protein